VRNQTIQMVEMCPSGTLTFVPDGGAEVVEPHLSKKVAVVPDGPLWVSRGIPVVRGDG